MRRRSKRASTRPVGGDEPVPTVLPHVVMTVAEDTTMTVTLDGAPYEPVPPAAPWRRGAVAEVLDQLTGQLRSPLRVEVREADGTVFTDIVLPPNTQPTQTEPEETPTALPNPTGASLVTVLGVGFVPGEDVMVALVIARFEAAADGSTRARLTGEQLAARPTAEVILYGRVSGTVVIGRPK